MIVADKVSYIDPTAVVDEAADIGEGVRIWHFCHIMGGCRIGDNSSLGQNVLIARGVTIGANVKVQNNVSIYSGVTCADNVFIGPSVVFTNVINPRSEINRKDQYMPTRVDEGATIGANATIVCGVTIGRYAFIGAGAVVVKDIAPYSLVVGNPARHIGWMSEHGHRLNFDNDNQAICPESGNAYRLLNQTTVVKLT